MKLRLLLLGIVVVALALQCKGRRMELPYAPHRDERFFVDYAKDMTANGDLNPHWFGHPGSPTLYSLALLYHLRNVWRNGAPLFHADPGLAAEFAAEPSPFYMVGRYWQMLFGCLGILLVFLLARRLFDTPTALAAAWLIGTNPFVAVMCKFARSDGISLFLAAAAALQIVRAMDRPTWKQQLLAGVMVGLATSNKYYLGVYSVGLLSLGRPGDRWRPVLAAGVLSVAIFFAACPFLGPDFVQAWRRNVDLELRPFSGGDLQIARFDAASWTWYFSAALPRLLGWLGTAVLAVGAALLVKERHRGRLLLLLVPICFLGVCGIPGLRKTYWLVAILPLFSTLMAHALAVVARGRIWALVLLALAVSAPPLWTALARDRVLEGPTPRYSVRKWIFDHAEPGARIVEELDGAPWMTLPPRARIDRAFVAHHGPLEVHVQVVLRLDGTLGRYRCDGVRYLLVNQSNVETQGETPVHREAAARARLMAEFPEKGPRFEPAHATDYEIGDVFLPVIRIYDLDGLPCEP